MSDEQLMEDYFAILEQCPDPDEAFKHSPTEKCFASNWLSRLCIEIYRKNDEKQLRNLYLIELSKCIKQGKLKKHFMSLPPKGNLEPLERSLKVQVDHKNIIEEMQAAAAELIPHVGPRNYQAHMSTKMFDDNQGACAYLAVSLGDPKDGPIWMKMGSAEPFNQTKIKQENLPEDCDYSDDKVNADFLELCLDETAKEISGLAKPGESRLLEEQLALYEQFIRDYDIGNEAIHLNKSEFRTFLLMNFQTDLVHALQRCQ